MTVKSQWKTLPLKECLNFISRGVAPKYVPKSAIAVLNQKAIRWGYIEERFLKYHDPDKKVKPEAYIQKGDIVVNSTGDITIGRAFYFKRAWSNLFADSHVTIIRLNRKILLPEFAINLFPMPEYQSKIYGLVTGTTGQLELSKNNLSKLEIEVPPLPTQRKIAAILSAYDDLIENNTRRIKILEEMAQAIYREWFVHFRFPGHEGVRMVESELGLIPEGWEVVSFTDIADVLSGGTPKTTIKEYWGGSIPFFTPKDASDSFYITETEKSITDLGLSRCNSKLYPKDTVFITARGTVGKVVLSSNEMAMNQSCYALKGKSMITQHFLFLATRQQVDYLKKNTGGATFDTIVIDTLRLMQIVRPDPNVISEFSMIIKPFMDSILNLLTQNITLRRTRDLLLPKLISGELDVSELDITIPEENT